VLRESAGQVLGDGGGAGDDATGLAHMVALLLNHNMIVPLIFKTMV
jgi:hypothetical protein